MADPGFNLVGGGVDFFCGKGVNIGVGGVRKSLKVLKVEVSHF